MQKEGKKVRKYLTKEIEPLIKLIDERAGLTEEAICEGLGYNRGYISQLRSREKAGEGPQVSQKFFNLLNNYANGDLLQNANNKPKPKKIEDPYTELLKSNDRFFKNQYAAFNAQVMSNLSALIALGEKSVALGEKAEALMKLNLQHIGIVEAKILDADPDVVQEQIGNQIAGIPAGDETDSGDDKNDKP